MKDYYSILGVNKTATTEEIKSAFKKLALKYHPDKHTNAPEHLKKEYSTKFMEIKHAYDVLSDEEKRKNYDRFGTEEPFGQNFSGNNFDPRDFFGSAGFKYKSTNFNFGNGFSEFFSQGTSPFETFFKESSRKTPNDFTEIKLRCTLDELYTGCTKDLRVTRNTFKGTEAVNLRLVIKPGYKKGTKFTFRDHGDQLADGSYKDIKVILDEIPHTLFRRIDDDLCTSVSITFKELIGGFTKTLLLPGNRKFTVTEKDVKSIGNEVIIPFMGMPLQNSTSNRGALRIVFVMNVPNLNINQREKLLSML